MTLVQVDGVRRTVPELVRCRLRPLLRVSNWGELERELLAARRRLEDLGVFHQVHAYVDTAGDDFSVHVLVREKGRFGLNLRPSVSGVNRLFAAGVAELRNIDGKGRSVEFAANRCLWHPSSSFGQEEVGLRLKSPFFSLPFAKVAFGVGAVRDVPGPPDYFLTAFRTHVSLPVGALPSQSSHTFGVNLFVNPSKPDGNDTSFLLEHSFERNAMLAEDGWPSGGSWFQLSNWLPLSRSGISSQSEHEVTLSWHAQPLGRFPRCTFTAALRVGAMLPMDGATEARPMRLNACTGPGGVRGPAPDEKDGPVRGCAVLHLFWPLPYLRGWLGSLLRCHAFAAFGSSGTTSFEVLKGSGARCSLGLGLAAFWQGFGFAELSACLPVISSQPRDLRLCIGIGTELL